MKSGDNKKAGVIGVVLLSVMWASAALAKERIMLTLDVVESEEGTVLEVDRTNTSGPPCLREDHPGCFNVRESETAEFRVTLKHGDNECNNAKWKLLDVRLGGESGPDAASGKPSAWGNLSSAAVGDFGADAATGTIERITTQGNSSLVFWDDNQYAMSIWYTVRAQSCADGTEIISMDPRIDNKGTGSSG